MTATWTGDRLAALIRLGRRGDEWGDIGAATDSNGEAAKSAWQKYATSHDKRARSGSKSWATRSRSNPPEKTVLRSPETEPFGDAVFQDDPRVQQRHEYGRKPERADDARYSVVPSSAGWVRAG